LNDDDQSQPVSCNQLSPEYNKHLILEWPLQIIDIFYAELLHI